MTSLRANVKFSKTSFWNINVHVRTQDFPHLRKVIWVGIFRHVTKDVTQQCCSLGVTLKKTWRVWCLSGIYPWTEIQCISHVKKKKNSGVFLPPPKKKKIMLLFLWKLSSCEWFKQKKHTKYHNKGMFVNRMVDFLYVLQFYVCQTCFIVSRSFVTEYDNWHLRPQL